MELGIFLVGIGGHGLQQVGKALAEVGWKHGFHVTYSPKYEPAKRGGLSSAYVVISDEPVGNPRKAKNDILVLMDPVGYERFKDHIKPDGLMIVNDSIVHAPAEQGATYRRVELPLSRMANEVGTTKTISAVLLGALASALKANLPDAEEIRDMMLGKIKLNDKVKEMNIEAFRFGYEAFENKIKG